MNVSISSLGDVQHGYNEGVTGGYKTLSKDDVFAQNRYLSNTNEFENWSLKTEGDDFNTYLEEYE